MDKLVRTAKILAITFICLVLLTGIVSFLVGFIRAQNAQQSSASVIPASQSGPVQTEEKLSPNAAELLNLVNEERAKVGAAPLQNDERLAASAQEKAKDLKLNNYFEHVSPITGVRGLDILKEATSYQCTYVGENLSRAGETSAKVVRVWLGSTEGHREAMLNNRYKLTGFGIQDEIVVQHFCDLN